MCAKAFAGECAAFLALPDASVVAKQDDGREQGDEDGVQQKHFGGFSLACMCGLCPSLVFTMGVMTGLRCFNQRGWTAARLGSPQSLAQEPGGA